MRVDAEVTLHLPSGIESVSRLVSWSDSRVGVAEAVDAPTGEDGWH
jgi:hypothetical protein